VFAQLQGAYGGVIVGAGSSYPYPFLNPTPAGVGNDMFLYIGGMLAGFLLLGYLIFAADCWMAKRAILK
jgi:hypothetical protein